MQYIDQIILICVGLFIAFNPSTFVRGYDKKSPKSNDNSKNHRIWVSHIFCCQHCVSSLHKKVEKKRANTSLYAGIFSAKY